MVTEQVTMAVHGYCFWLGVAPETSVHAKLGILQSSPRAPDSLASSTVDPPTGRTAPRNSARELLDLAPGFSRPRSCPGGASPRASLSIIGCLSTAMVLSRSIPRHECFRVVATKAEARRLATHRAGFSESTSRSDSGGTPPGPQSARWSRGPVQEISNPVCS